jgi:aminoglycoside phosphotransferase
MANLRHGYTNLTRRLPDQKVEKRYQGTDALQRAECEYVCLTHLGDRLPVPGVLEQDSSVPKLILREMSGMHAQDMIDSGRAAEVLRLVGTLLTRLQQIAPSSVPGLTGVGPVLVHGDFGPQNVLVNGDTLTALLDWEFAHVGDAIEDLAWAEWIVRMHHPNHVDALPELLDTSGIRSGWPERQGAMVSRCDELMRMAEAAGSADTTALWRGRLRVTEQWKE